MSDCHGPSSPPVAKCGTCGGIKIVEQPGSGHAVPCPACACPNSPQDGPCCTPAASFEEAVTTFGRLCAAHDNDRVNAARQRVVEMYARQESIAKERSNVAALMIAERDAFGLAKLKAEAEAARVKAVVEAARLVRHEACSGGGCGSRCYKHQDADDALDAALADVKP